MRRRSSKSSAYIMLGSRESSPQTRLSTPPSPSPSHFHPITHSKIFLVSINPLVRSRTHEPMEADVSILNEAEGSSLPGYPCIPSKLMVLWCLNKFSVEDGRGGLLRTIIGITRIRKDVESQRRYLQVSSALDLVENPCVSGQVRPVRPRQTLPSSATPPTDQR